MQFTWDGTCTCSPSESSDSPDEHHRGGGSLSLRPMTHAGGGVIPSDIREDGLVVVVRCIYAECIYTGQS